MKSGQFHLYIAGVLLLLVNNLSAAEFASLDVNLLDLNTLAISDKQLSSCSKTAEGPYAGIRKAIEDKQYIQALNRLEKPGQAAAAEHQYLYGRIHYLLAYELVQSKQAEQPDTDYLSIARQYIGLAANAGFAEALYHQALFLTSPLDATKKLGLLRKAAQKNYVPAMLDLAEEMFVASGTFEERIDAQAMVQKAAELDSNAKIKLASYYLHEDRQLKTLTGYEKNVNQAIYLLYEAASSCNAVAAYKLYQLASKEHKPNRLDEARGLYWLTKSAELGLAAAQGELAEHYYRQADEQQLALEWSKRAAAKNDLKALLTLGRMHYSGEGAEKDLAKALGYYEKALAVDRHNRLVQNQLGIMYYKGEGSQPDFRRAASLCKQAANKGQAGCQYYLGLMYVNGEGVTQDIDTGISWMKKSAAQDYSIAKNWLRENW